MLLKKCCQLILLIVSVTTSYIRSECISFEKESGFIRLLPTPIVNNNSVISMEVKAYNCDDLSLTIHNGKNFKLTVHNEGMFGTDDGSIHRFKIFGSCTGLWNEGISEI